MSNDIKAGDLVMVIKPRTCCGYAGGVGVVRTVVGVAHPVVKCSCGEITDRNICVKLSSGRSCEISRLKKIPPLSDLEDVTTQRQDLLPNEQKEVV